MNGSWKIDVIKRDGSREPFRVEKLAAVLWRVGMQHGREYSESFDQACAIRIYLKRTDEREISSAELLGLVFKAMYRMKLPEGVVLVGLHSSLRSRHRNAMRVIHGNGSCVAWDKSWLAQVAERMWNISPTVSRIIAGEVEADLLEHECALVRRDVVIEILNTKVSEFGLAEAVPVRQYEVEG